MIKERTEAEKLEASEIATRLANTKGWHFEVGLNAIVSDIVAKDFSTAVEIINRVAKLAETHDHHPDILLYRYKHLRVIFTTHSAGGVTENDIEMAGLVNDALGDETHPS